MATATAEKKKTTAKKTTKKTTAKKTGKKYLVIVESPAKAATIGKFLGSNYKIEASMGHIRDLPKSQLGIDFENDFDPKYITIRGKGELLSKLRKDAKAADKVYLATDPDREGEAISWHLLHALNLEEEKNISRITFNEITKTAVKKSITEARDIDMDLVDAQQARRVLDRVVGYTISDLLWKKVKKGLSGGRVQSVALRLVCDREEEIRDFIPEEYWTLGAKLTDEAGKVFEARFYGKGEEKVELANETETNTVLKGIDGKDFEVTEVKTGSRQKKPVAPFITLSRHSLYDNHIFVMLHKGAVHGSYVLMLDRKGEANLSTLDSSRTDKGNTALNRLCEEHTLATGVDNETRGHLESQGRESLGEARDVLNYLSLLNALRQGESAVLLVNHEIVVECGKHNGVLGLTPVGRGGNGYGSRLRTLAIGKNDRLLKRDSSLLVLLLADKEVNLIEGEALSHLTTEACQSRCAGNGGRKHNYKSAVLLEVLTCHLSEEVGCAYLNLSYTTGTLCLSGTLLNKVCGRVADDNIELVLHYVNEGDRVVILGLGDIVFLINCNVNSDVIVVASLFSDTLEVVLKHIHKLGVVFVAGNENLTAILTSLTYFLDYGRGKYTRACAGVEHRVCSLGLIEGKHIRHKTCRFLFGEESAKTHVITLGLRAYELGCISDGHI